jgi:predicted transcriptional regulator
VEWKRLTFVLRGKIRQKVLQSLDKPKTATTIAKDINTHRSTVSRVLGLLQTKGFVTCLDEREPFNRYYKRTRDGDLAIKEIEKIE